MFDYLPISYLNDYVFCPYSIYLHNVYKGGDEDLYYSHVQTDGRNVHQSIDKKEHKKAPSKDLVGIAIYSKKLGVMGKIDLYRTSDETLIERKRKITRVYQGQIWQVQAQYMCMIEMGYTIENMYIHSLSDNTNYPIAIPKNTDIEKLQRVVDDIRDVHHLENIVPNPNKCTHCIYNNLCDKSVAV